MRKRHHEKKIMNWIKKEEEAILQQKVARLWKLSDETTNLSEVSAMSNFILHQ